MYTGVISTFSIFAFVLSLKSTANCCGFGTWLLSIHPKVVLSPLPFYLLARSSSISGYNVFRHFTPSIFYFLKRTSGILTSSWSLDHTTSHTTIILHVIRLHRRCRYRGTTQQHARTYRQLANLVAYELFLIWKGKAQTKSVLSTRIGRSTSVNEPWYSRVTHLDIMHDFFGRPRVLNIVQR